MHSHYWNVLVWGLLSASVVLLSLGVWQVLKRTQLGRLTGLAWVAFAIGFGSIAVGLDIMNTTWHLPNAQKPWALASTLGGVAVFFMAIACIVLTQVGFFKEAEIAERNARLSEEALRTDKSWPPAPRNP